MEWRNSRPHIGFWGPAAGDKNSRKLAGTQGIFGIKLFFINRFMYDLSVTATSVPGVMGVVCQGKMEQKF